MRPYSMAFSSPGIPFSPRSVSVSLSRQGVRPAPDKWHAYTLALTEKSLVSAFAIFGLKNFREWTSTPGFRVSKDEARAIVDGFANELHIRFGGIFLNGMAFTLTRMSCQRVMMVGRSSATGSGCVLYLCQTCLLIATHEEGPQTSLCFAAIEKLGDFLKDRGF